MNLAQSEETPEGTGSLAFPVSKLKPKEHGTVLCYPGTDIKSFDSRVKQLRKLGVSELILEGSSKVGKYGVLGKGCVSLVVKAKLEDNPEIVALKIRRVDANRPSTENDYELQKYANSFGVGPKAISASRDFFAMEYIDSVKIGAWFKALKMTVSKKYARKLVRDSLWQCHLLDAHGLDHGELSNPSKHVLIRNRPGEPKTVLIDYESASRTRRPQNFTSVAQFLFLGGWQGVKLRKILGIEKGIILKEARKPLESRESKRVVSLLRAYKKEPSEKRFEKFMDYVGC